MDYEPFIGSEAVAAGTLTPYELRRYHRAILPSVYVPENTEPSVQQRAIGAWLWSGRQGVVAGLAASALHGAKWVDDDIPVELIWRNARPPSGVITRHDRLLDGEAKVRDGLPVTTPERTAFDLGRRGGLMRAVAHLDALARATRFHVSDVAGLVAEHPHTRGLRRLEQALDLVDRGAESPKETWLRLLLIRQGYPRPRTQIPVISPDGWRKYYLDMGWKTSSWPSSTRVITTARRRTPSPMRSNVRRTSTSGDGMSSGRRHEAAKPICWRGCDARGGYARIDSASTAKLTPVFAQWTQSQREKN